MDGPNVPSKPRRLTLTLRPVSARTATPNFEPSTLETFQLVLKRPVDGTTLAHELADYYGISGRWYAFYECALPSDSPSQPSDGMENGHAPLVNNTAPGTLDDLCDEISAFFERGVAGDMGRWSVGEDDGRKGAELYAEITLHTAAGVRRPPPSAVINIAAALPSAPLAIAAPAAAPAARALAPAPALAAAAAAPSAVPASLAGALPAVPASLAGVPSAVPASSAGAPPAVPAVACEPSPPLQAPRPAGTTPPAAEAPAPPAAATGPGGVQARFPAVPAAPSATPAEHASVFPIVDAASPLGTPAAAAAAHASPLATPPAPSATPAAAAAAAPASPSASPASPSAAPASPLAAPASPLVAAAPPAAAAARKPGTSQPASAAAARPVPELAAAATRPVPALAAAAAAAAATRPVPVLAAPAEAPAAQPIPSMAMAAVARGLAQSLAAPARYIPHPDPDSPLTSDLSSGSGRDSSGSPAPRVTLSREHVDQWGDPQFRGRHGASERREDAVETLRSWLPKRFLQEAMVQALLNYMPIHTQDVHARGSPRQGLWVIQADFKEPFAQDWDTQEGQLKLWSLQACTRAATGYVMVRAYQELCGIRKGSKGQPRRLSLELASGKQLEFTIVQLLSSRNSAVRKGLEYGDHQGRYKGMRRLEMRLDQAKAFQAAYPELYKCGPTPELPKGALCTWRPSRQYYRALLECFQGSYEEDTCMAGLTWAHLEKFRECGWSSVEDHFYGSRRVDAFVRSGQAKAGVKRAREEHDGDDSQEEE